MSRSFVSFIQSHQRKILPSLLISGVVCTSGFVVFGRNDNTFQHTHDNNSKNNNNDDGGGEIKMKDEETAGMKKNAEGSFYNYFSKRQLWQPKRPYPAWDSNWDQKHSSSHDNNDDADADADAILTGVTRHVILIRHGQYDETHPEDEKRVLTELGRKQADLTGQRLAIMQKGINEMFGPCSIKTIRVSNMTRAKETASIIAKHLPQQQQIVMDDPDPLLNEGLPAQVIPSRKELKEMLDTKVDEEHDRIEEAFQKYIHRSTSSSSSSSSSLEDEKHEFEIIVCHGNVIRYFFCRALQLPPEAWLRLCTFNCSLTYLMISPNGRVSCRMMGDIGHLGYDHSTFSMNHGFVWP